MLETKSTALSLEEERKLSENNPDLNIITPLVSVLIPGWNESARLPDCVDSILALRYPNIELILCVGGEDATWELAEQYACPQVLILKQMPGEGKQKALQRCFERSSGEIILLSDADCIWDDDAFEGNLRALREGNEAVVTGSWKPLAKQTGKALVQFQWWRHILREMTLPDFVTLVSGCNTALTRKALVQSGALLLAAPIGTDYRLARALIQAGFNIRFVRKSRVQTEYPEYASDYIKQRSRWQRNNLVHGFKYRDWASLLAQSRLILAGIAMLALPFAAGINFDCLYIWLCILAYLYLAQICLYRRVKKWGGSDLQLRPYLLDLVLFLVIDWLASARAFVEALFPPRRWKW
jgi:cellulose synthase/poly-beta-1,6-N-acetylglucosamine synthase-like glycosyltransferase